MPDLSSSLRDLIDGSMRPVDVDAIVRTRRRRRLRRRVSVGSVLIVIAAVVTGTVLARPASEPKVLAVGGSGDAGPAGEADATRAALAGLTVVSPGTSGVQMRADLAKGAVDLTDPVSAVTRNVPFPVSQVQTSGSPVVVGSDIVLVLDPPGSDSLVPYGSAYVMSSSFDEWRSIGAASSVIASLDPGRVWRTASGAVSEENLAGDEQQSYPLSSGRVPIAAVTGGLLTARAVPNSAQQIVEVWDPVTNRVVRSLPAGASVVAAHGAYAVLDVCPKACGRELFDLRSGRTVPLAPPPGLGWGSEAAFSPDGLHVALVAHAPLTAREQVSQSPFPPSGTHASAVSIVDLSTGTRTTRRVTTWKGATPLAWSPDGSFVFFTRTASEVDYFNTTFAHAAMRALSVPGADGFLLAAAPAPSTATQQFSYDGLISQSPQHSPELCVYASATVGESGYDGCAGPAVAGWDWSKVRVKQTAGGITSGKFHVVGTYDGDVFTLTQPPTAARPVAPPAPPEVPTPCPTPPGGWQDTNPALLTLPAYNAMTGAARSAPDFAGLWFSGLDPIGSAEGLAHGVYDIVFTGNLDVHRSQLAALWGGSICVVQHPRPYRQLQNISHLLFGDYGRQLGLQLIDAGPDEARDVVQGDAVAVTVEQQRALDQRFGGGVVDLRSELRPVG